MAALRARDETTAGITAVPLSLGRGVLMEDSMRMESGLPCVVKAIGGVVAAIFGIGCHGLIPFDQLDVIIGE